MRNNYLVCLMLALCICCFSVSLVYAQPTPPEGTEWEVVPELTDEFDTWDGTKWRRELWNYPVPNIMMYNNAGVTDGKLWIKTSVAEDENAERWFETSRIYSIERISYPMYIECSMKTAHVSAYNTFWLNNGNDLNRDEIDICENMSNPIDNDPDLPYLRQSQYFIVKDGTEYRSTRVNPDVEGDYTRVADFDNRNLSNDNPAKGKKWNEDFQTFGLYWKDSRHMIYYINGEESGRDTSKVPFTKHLNVIWDIWTNDHDGGLATKESLLEQSDTENTMYIDWVHTYSYPREFIPSNVTEAKVKNFEVYPNPATDMLGINFTNNIQSNASLQIYDGVGRLVQTEQLTTERNQISINELASGVYTVKITNGNSISSQLIVKE